VRILSPHLPISRGPYTAMYDLGTFFLALNIGMCSGDLAPFAVGGTLMIMVYAFGHISGGHFNPAVTLAVYLRGKLGDATNAAYYALAQFAGAFAGAFVSNILSDEPGYPAPAADAGALKALLAEAIYTFALCSVVLNVTTTKNQEGNSFFGLAIGATLTCSALAAAGISVRVPRRSRLGPSRCAQTRPPPTGRRLQPGSRHRASIGRRRRLFKRVDLLGWTPARRCRRGCGVQAHGERVRREPGEVAGRV